jgi:predicted nucleotidyltransferase
MQALKKISPEAMAAYRRTARLRAAAHTERRRQRLKHGLEVARRAAALLRECFQVEKVVIFGSLLRPEHFSEHSDVDLAVWGLADQDYLQAVAAVTALDPEITVDLIAVEQAPLPLRQRTEQEGKEI